MMPKRFFNHFLGVVAFGVAPANSPSVRNHIYRGPALRLAFET